jgi:thioesterase domain-containing protein
VQAVVPVQGKGTRPPLFVVSGLDGHVLVFHRLAFHLGEDQPVYGLVPRGRNGHEPSHMYVEEMAAYYVEAIRRVQPEGPYRLLGHSFGGIVAFEVAQQLVAQGVVVSLLGLLDTIEPQYNKDIWKSLEFRQRLACFAAEFKTAMRMRDPFAPLRIRFKRKTSRAISKLLRALGRPHPARLPFVRINDANLIAAANYQPRRYPAALTLFRSTMRDLHDGADEFLGWGRLVAGGIELHHIPATHSGIVHEPAVRILSDKLAECLDRDLAPADADLLVATSVKDMHLRPLSRVVTATARSPMSEYR